MALPPILDAIPPAAATGEILDALVYAMNESTPLDGPAMSVSGEGGAGNMAASGPDLEAVLDAISMDLNGDGVSDLVGLLYGTEGSPDMMAVDLDNDGMIDMFAADVDGDGAFDAVFFDTDGDGMFDSALLDTDLSGSFDTVVTDNHVGGILEGEQSSSFNIFDMF